MKAQQSEKSQSDKFKEAAREAGADESEETFAKKLKKLATVKPKKGAKK